METPPEKTLSEKSLPEETPDKRPALGDSSRSLRSRTTYCTDPRTELRSHSPRPKKPTPILRQPETRPITQEQLVNEVKGIYAGLVMVERKCVEVDQKQSSTKHILSNEQWQALIAMHRTLLHEHHDFLLASQHPSSSTALRRLATKYAMPARMWRHGIHSFLELLRHRLPDSLEHMLSFIYLAYSMMGLLMESVPSFEDTWIECLGDLARYRMAIEEANLQDRQTWAGVAQMWYYKAADRSPNVGRIQHHLAVLARPNIVQQLYYYSKALVTVIPFPNARESVMLLFNPFLESSEITSQRYPLVEATLVKANGILFTHGSILEYESLIGQFCGALDNHIGRVTAKFRVQGPEIASSLCAATFGFGLAEAFLSKCFREKAEKMQQEAERKQQETEQQETKRETEQQETKRETEQQETKRETEQQETEKKLLLNWRSTIYASELIRADSSAIDARFSDSKDPAVYACQALGETITVVAQRIGDKNTLPFMHVILAYLFGLAFIPNAILYIEACIPWKDITDFLNATLGSSGVLEAEFQGEDFPKRQGGTGRQLPEDFIMRGLIWVQNYFPSEFFTELTDEDERHIELPSSAAPRAERCLWLGAQLASLNRWISYDKIKFSITKYATHLESIRPLYSRSRTLSVERHLDSEMIDVDS